MTPTLAATWQEWEPALRLCRYVKSEMLWACLAAMAVAGKELHTAEVAYAAISHVDKLLYMCHIKELPTVEAREAELLLFRRRQAEAVAVLVQGGWVYRAIKARACRASRVAACACLLADPVRRLFRFPNG